MLTVVYILSAASCSTCVNPVTGNKEATLLSCHIRIKCCLFVPYEKKQPRRTNVFSLNVFTILKSCNVFASDKKTLFAYVWNRVTTRLLRHRIKSSGMCDAKNKLLVCVHAGVYLLYMFMRARIQLCTDACIRVCMYKSPAASPHPDLLLSWNPLDSPGPRGYSPIRSRCSTEKAMNV